MGGNLHPSLLREASPMGRAADIQREYFETIRAQDFEKLRTMFHPEYEFIDEEGVRHDIDGSLDKAREYVAGAPDMEFDIERQLELGDVCVMEATITATHTGELFGIPPSGKRISLKYCNVVEIRDGHSYREHDYSDNLTLLRQIGALPAQT
jgi:predicted ester cyclase